MASFRRWVCNSLWILPENHDLLCWKIATDTQLLINTVLEATMSCAFQSLPVVVIDRFLGKGESVCISFHLSAGHRIKCSISSTICYCASSTVSKPKHRMCSSLTGVTTWHSFYMTEDINYATTTNTNLQSFAKQTSLWTTGIMAGYDLLADVVLGPRKSPGKYYYGSTSSPILRELE